MNIFTVRAYFESRVHSDFSFSDLEEAARFCGEVIEAGFKVSFSRSSLDKLGNQRIALEAMHKALGVARDAAKTPA